MNRKNFLSSVVPLLSIKNGITFSESTVRSLNSMAIKIPPYLKNGDCIGITCPGGYITSEEIAPAIATLKGWGFDVHVGAAIGKRDYTFGGTDEERKNDLQALLNDKKIKAILFARGGYGAIRIIDAIEFTSFVKHPKWLIGFSDITTIHGHVHTNTGVATIHAKMCNSFPSDWLTIEQTQKDSIESIRQCLVGEKMNYQLFSNSNNKLGTATGVLIGGNLKTIETLAGSKSDIDTTNKLLFVEDTGEYLYSIDRMFWQLKRSGKLAALAGLIVGGFKIKKDEADTDEFGKTLEQIVLEKISDYTYPVCFDFPVGHQKYNMALKCGIQHQLIVSNNNIILNELR
jgi:muramoyltetrapeptide carboxypeptidase